MKQYLILDGAILEHKLEQALSLHEQHRSLYRGQTVPEIEAVGPYLFPYPHTDAFNSWFIGNGLRNNWGILVNAAVSLDEIENHFRQFLMVKTEEGQELYFRFYDPRVLRIFLPTCDAAQLREMFGAVHSFVCHDADDSFLFQYTLRNNTLYTATLPTENLFPQSVDQILETQSAPELKENLPAQQQDPQTPKAKPFRFIE